jgi:hypothetical protein
MSRSSKSDAFSSDRPIVWATNGWRFALTGLFHCITAGGMARGVSVRNAKQRAKNISDAMACAHWDARNDGNHRKQGANLTIHPCVNVSRVRLDARQTTRDPASSRLYR